jgi:uncharacterized protein DUF6134
MGRMCVTTCFTALLAAGPLAASATEPDVLSVEQRTYEISVDGAKAGQSACVITTYADGLEVAKTDAKVSVGFAIFTYVYEYHGAEQWRGGRLAKVESRAIDGWKRLSLLVDVQEGGSAVSAQGARPANGPRFEMSTSFWRLPLLPAPELTGRKLSVVDADNGKSHQIELQLAGREELAIGAEKSACWKYQVQGTLSAELWYDGQGRLVRQTGVEDGHKTVRQLASVRKSVAR